MRLSKRLNWVTALVVALGLMAGVVSADLINSTGKLGPVLGGGSSSSSFSGGVLSVGTSINNDLCLTIGTTDTSASPCLRYDTTQTVDAGMLLTGTVGNAWIIAERQDETFDFAHAQQTTPTLFIHSASQSAAQWISVTHDGTNGVFALGTGLLVLPGDVRIGAGTGTLWLGSAADYANPTLTRSASQTPDAPLLGTGTVSNLWLLAEAQDTAFDFAHAATTNPTLFIHSAAQNTTQWVGVAHNGTHPVISSGLGPVALVGGANVASAAALPLPTGNVFHVTGTTTVTSITSTGFVAGMQIVLIFDGVLTFTDGSNLKLFASYVTTADDTITLAYDGTNWYETARSVN
jgi:hypothetical protein